MKVDFDGKVYNVSEGFYQKYKKLDLELKSKQNHVLEVKNTNLTQNPNQSKDRYNNVEKVSNHRNESFQSPKDEKENRKKQTNQELREQAQVLKKRNDALVDKFNGLLDEYQKLKQHATKETEELKSLEKEKETENRQLDEELKVCREQIHALKNKIAVLTDKFVQYQDEYHNFRKHLIDKNKDLRALIEDKDNEKEKLTKELEVLQGENSVLTNKLNKLRQLQQKLEDSLTEVKRECKEKIQRNNDQHRAHIEEINLAVEKRRQEEESAAACKIHRKDEQIVSLKQKLIQHMNEANDLSVENKNLKTALDNNAAENEKLAASNSELENECRNLKMSLESQETKMNELNTDNSKLKKMFKNELSKLNNYHRKQVDELNKSTEKQIQVAKSHLEYTISEQNKQIGIQSKTLLRYENEIKELSEKSREYNLENQDLKNFVDACKRNNNEVETERKKLKLEVEISQKKMSELENQKSLQEAEFNARIDSLMNSHKDEVITKDKEFKDAMYKMKLKIKELEGVIDKKERKYVEDASAELETLKKRSEEERMQMEDKIQSVSLVNQNREAEILRLKEALSKRSIEKLCIGHSKRRKRCDSTTGSTPNPDQHDVPDPDQHTDTPDDKPDPDQRRRKKAKLDMDKFLNGFIKKKLKLCQSCSLVDLCEKCKREVKKETDFAKRFWAQELQKKLETDVQMFHTRLEEIVHPQDQAREA